MPHHEDLIKEAWRNQMSAKAHPGTCPPQLTPGLRWEMQEVQQQRMAMLLPEKGTSFDTADVSPSVKEMLRGKGHVGVSGLVEISEL